MIVALLLLCSVLMACGSATNNENDHNNKNEANKTSETNDQTANDDEVNEEEGSNENHGDDQAEPEEDLITKTGTYNGQADPHTIEVETDEGPTAFQLSDKAREDVEGLNPGVEVTYTYYEKGEQRIITSIKKSAAANETGDRITEIGIYNGQADTHTIEIETNSGPLAFQLSMEARDEVADLNPGDQVTYTFTKDGDNRVIESIHKVD